MRKWNTLQRDVKKTLPSLFSRKKRMAAPYRGQKRPTATYKPERILFVEKAAILNRRESYILIRGKIHAREIPSLLGERGKSGVF